MWRECGEISVERVNVFQSCHPVLTFRKAAASIILGFSISATFTSLCLGHTRDRLGKDDAYLLKIITKHWLQRTCPPAGLLVSNVKHLHLLERMTYSVRLQKEFEKENGVRKMVSLQTRLFLKKPDLRWFADCPMALCSDLTFWFLFFSPICLYVHGSFILRKVR